MLEQLTDLLIPLVAIITLFGGGYGVIYFFLKTRSQQRLAMIEKGLDRDIFSGATRPDRLRRWGILLIGIGLGIMIGQGLRALAGLAGEIAFPVSITVAVGVALILASRVKPATGQS
ncbi:MAG: DUF6249 domain-containing protein [Gammaproteobacteria bacterium]